MLARRPSRHKAQPRHRAVAKASNVMPAPRSRSTSAMPIVTDGRARAFAVTSPARLPRLPDMPTAAQALMPGLEVSVRHGPCAARPTL